MDSMMIKMMKKFKVKKKKGLGFLHDVFNSFDRYIKDENVAQVAYIKKVLIRKIKAQNDLKIDQTYTNNLETYIKEGLENTRRDYKDNQEIVHATHYEHYAIGRWICFPYYFIMQQVLETYAPRR